MEKYSSMIKGGDGLAISKKQAEIVKCIEKENPKILVCSGAKRTEQERHGF